LSLIPFQARERFGYPATREAAALTTNGRTYILDFGTNVELRQRALKSDGKTLRLRDGRRPLRRHVHSGST
jgi:hypothetical protein